MRKVWLADENSQPFIVPGSGTLAMEMAVTNVLDAGDLAVVVDTGYFSQRMVEMIRRRGSRVAVVSAPPGEAPPLTAVEAVLSQEKVKALFSTHVDTSTGVRVDAEALTGLAKRFGALSVFDGVCATAAERFDMSGWGADVYLTASQKAIGLPSGLALMVVSQSALATRGSLKHPPPMSVDFDMWRPVMEAYEEGRPSYFSTPSTNLIGALYVGLQEILASELGEIKGVDARFNLHTRAASAFRAAWRSLGVCMLPATELIAANTLCAVKYPRGVDSRVLSLIKDRGVIVAGGLFPGLSKSYFRVGHMGHTVTRDDWIVDSVEAISASLVKAGHRGPVQDATNAACGVLDASR